MLNSPSLPHQKKGHLPKEPSDDGMDAPQEKPSADKPDVKPAAEKPAETEKKSSPEEEKKDEDQSKNELPVKPEENEASSVSPAEKAQAEAHEKHEKEKQQKPEGLMKPGEDLSKSMTSYQEAVHLHNTGTAKVAYDKAKEDAKKKQEEEDAKVKWEIVYMLSDVHVQSFICICVVDVVNASCERYLL